MYCPKCSNKINENDAFCTICGERIIDSAGSRYQADVYYANSEIGGNEFEDAKMPTYIVGTIISIILLLASILFLIVSISFLTLNPAYKITSEVVASGISPISLIFTQGIIAFYALCLLLGSILKMNAAKRIGNFAGISNSEKALIVSALAFILALIGFLIMLL